MLPELPAGVELNRLTTHDDERGAFVEILRPGRIDAQIAQVSVSTSNEGALRGLHFHRRQTDIWHLLDGELEVALVDLRLNDPQPVTFTWSSSDPSTLRVPPGVAHGYAALSRSRILYMFTREHDPADEFGIAWNDPDLATPWRIQHPVLSERDANNPTLAELRSGGRLDGLDR